MARSRTAEIAAGLDHLRQADPVMARLIDRVGPFLLKLDRDHFKMLVRSILSQQISTKAAQSIRGRLEELLGTPEFTPEALSALSLDQLRSCGLSGQKSRYMHDLAEKVASGDVRIDQLKKMSDEDVITELTQVLGIGVWTAQMCLIFSLGRMDVFPYDDFGVRAGIRRCYRLADLPTKAESLELAEPWRPYASMASWYLWRSGELPAEIEW